jgi:hypothetical protein
MRRTLVAVALATSLFATSPLDRLWSLFASLWTAPTPDAGCEWDPNGRCAPVVQPDAGCEWDPSGLCKPGS